MMPHFFKSIPELSLYDPLAQILGAASEGIIHYSYAECVKLAGHSCPTVAGTYLMLLKGLKFLYPDTMPQRGEIRVLMSGKLGDGVVGVMANIASFVTGATDINGFHGLGGKFDRRHLLIYEANIHGDMALERVDTGKRIVLSYNPKIIPADPKMGEWLELMISEKANFEIERLFQNAWQERVKLILTDYADHPGLVISTLEGKQ
ncbi:hypothetical protein [Sulfuricurvum sp.]|uniref:hypothetical protein n=1 Tax=Sulfuricurvum sp. TaxID=2025608 RepID=UPI0026240F7D|nr:hypothetical protein [Sulfuricurvum sp.]MDD2781725.1 hypothetical protein [Sulfuricurvum sp.]